MQIKNTSSLMTLFVIKMEMLQKCDTIHNS